LVVERILVSLCNQSVSYNQGRNTVFLNIREYWFRPRFYNREKAFTRSEASRWGDASQAVQIQ